MSNKFLFVAEADKIQDLLFRSARQRQVIGGSRLLAQFGEKITRVKNAKRIIWQGGSFVLSFNDKGEALDFREALQSLYYMVFDSTITCTEPEEYFEVSHGTKTAGATELSFAKVNRALHHQLNKNKRAKRPETDSAHSPITAYCQDTGTGLATAFQSLLPGEENEKYLCQTAIDFGYAGGISPKETEKSSYERSDEKDNFLWDIRASIKDDQLRENGLWPKTVDELGKLDPLNSNIAYMLVDVNGMGEIFSCCQDSDELSKLSAKLDKIMKRALVEYLPKLAEQLQGKIQKYIPKNNWLPMLPLIFAGDDGFVVLPAHYALDYAARFCEQFQEKIRFEFEEGELKQLNNELMETGIHIPTISAAVVFCKAKYPYHLVHQLGETLLQDAKRCAKYEYDGTPCGAISFEVITGNPLIKKTGEVNNIYKPSLKPYWVSSPGAGDRAISIKKLLTQRLELKDIPQKRLAELRELFAKELKYLNPQKDREEWLEKFEKILKRFRAVAGEETTWPKNLYQALETLGGQVNATAPYCYSGRSKVHNHGFPDLIEVWNYAQDLDRELSEY